MSQSIPIAQRQQQQQPPPPPSDRNLVLWLNTLPVPRAAVIDELGEVTPEVIQDVLSLVLERKFSTLKVALRCFENTFKLAPSDVTSSRMDLAAIRETLSLIRCAYVAGTAQPVPSHMMQPTSHTKPLLLPQPPPPVELSTILELVMSKRLAQHFSDHFQSAPGEALSDGVLLVSLVHALETKLGLTPRQIVTKRFGEDDVHVFVGVDVHPKTRAARLNNVDIGLRALREWKRALNPRYLWSAGEIVSKKEDVAIGLVQDMMACTRRNIGLIVHVPQTRPATTTPNTIIPPLQLKDTEVDDWPPPPPPPPPPQHIPSPLPTPPYHSGTLPPLLTPTPISFSSSVIGATAFARFFTNSMVELTPLEEADARDWLFQIGFNWLRIDASPVRKVDVKSCATREFFGYEGGPFLGDPLRNGTILGVLAGMLLHSGKHGESLDMNGGDPGSFPAAQNRVVSSLELLRHAARAKGLDPPPLLSNAENVMKGNSNVIWGIIYALSLVFPVLKVPQERFDHVDLDILLWRYMCNVSTIPRTRKTALDMLQNHAGLDEVMARRVHDGDWRLTRTLLQDRGMDVGSLVVVSLPPPPPPLQPPPPPSRSPDDEHRSLLYVAATTTTTTTTTQRRKPLLIPANNRHILNITQQTELHHPTFQKCHHIPQSSSIRPKISLVASPHADGRQEENKENHMAIVSTTNRGSSRGLLLL